ncbi:hypothetical protein [Kibdelosporangium phytohabitans]|uniref:Uncharacterized protein n=1 Tax=Kibdelosporangium phytohabitans TaxID=860235 RepID=A0A0N9IEA3_9PSEU|nr:hypothetical protein [Kibdelosporangium phytohabitans]ALG13122.1 hypothetical protein AOZ06_45285 [Kibdelosporangium phytohabitans]MBE1464866.1 hypothetical protein [Kibdelosporangium phytohabitans]
MRLAEEVLEDLAEIASECAPRLFAVYGVRHDRIADESDYFVAYGMELSDPPLAVLAYPDGSTHVSDSAELALRSHRIGAEARLIWLS